MSARCRRWVLCCLALVAAGTGGCAGGRVNMWPVYFREVREVPADGGTRRVTATDVLYPFFHRESNPDRSWHALRPLYNYETEPQRDRSRVQYLWPLGLYFRDGDKQTHHRLFPLFEHLTAWSNRHGRYSTHAHLLQILRWGEDAEFGPYLALFPLAGVTHGVISDTWSFVLFPLYSHYRQGNYVRDDFPWPFLGYGRSPDGRRVQYRFWPLYVYQRFANKLGLYERNDLLWPLVRWGGLDTGADRYSTVLAVTPLFSLIRTWDRQGELAAYRASILGISFGRDEREKRETGWGALWWLAESSRSPRKDTFRLFPFYWRTTYYRSRARDPQRSWTRRRILWPLLWHDSSDFEPGVHSESLVLAPLYWHYKDVHEREEEPDRVARSITLWPLATYRRRADGGWHFWLLSHGWKDATRGYKRNYRAFFDLFQYHHTADGQRETRVLSRLYHHRRGAGGRYLSLAGLFTYDSTAEVVGEDGSYVSALFGLLKYSWTEQDGTWRVLGIPL